MVVAQGLAGAPEAFNSRRAPTRPSLRGSVAHSAPVVAYGLKSNASDASLAATDITFTPSDFIAVVNQTLEYAYAGVLVVGEVASFKVNQGKWVFFDVKDEEASVSCFMPLWNLRQPLEDGMKVVVRGVPKLTRWGRFSLTVTGVRPVGEGSLKRAYEMLKKKLAAEGLFDPSRKRPVPSDLTRIGVISSTQAAGYADFVKIINARWGGMRIVVAHTQVQGMDAPDQIRRALAYFNERGEVQVIALIRGGGSADDLACFNDEQLVRAVAASRIPVITGVGHEVDESLTDLAADVRASTPSNAAELLTPDRKVVAIQVATETERLAGRVRGAISDAEASVTSEVGRMALATKNALNAMLGALETKCADFTRVILAEIEREARRVTEKERVIAALNPEQILKQGYAIVAGDRSPGSVVKITTFTEEIEAKVQQIKERS